MSARTTLQSSGFSAPGVPTARTVLGALWAAFAPDDRPLDDGPDVVAGLVEALRDGS